MAQVMAQAIPTATTPMIESGAIAAFNAINVVEVNKPSLLEQEAFPGELAALRAQSTQHKEPGFSVNTIASTNHAHSSSSEKQHPSDSLLADQLIELMPTGLVMLDGNGIVVKINQVAIDLLDEPILGQPWFNVIARSFNPREGDWHEISLKDGRRVKLEITSLGAQPGQLILITDLTETRLLQDKIAQMQRLSSLGKMVSTLAHQIRTPLSAAILYGENLISNKLAESARVDFQKKLNARLHDLEQQVNDMLLFSKSGKEQVVAPLAVNALIDDAVHSMDALISKAGAQVKVQYCEDELYILGNKSALTGAMQNLLHNALNAMTALPASSAAKIVAPLINIQVYSQDNHLYLSVKDNGPGIDLEIRDKIFQPFYTSSSKGTGLGLAVVKSVVNAHQGEVTLLNEADAGAGAHFVIKLPLLEQGSVMKNNPEGEY
ncbi:PAS domain-containing sensor histidine kinase [Colwellia sp. MT41]|nr:PAS domain-containing sensor histidine kinase [Colwellia sp. MT41]